MTDETTAKYLRLDSVTDKLLATVIQLPPPFSFVVVVANLIGAFVLGFVVRGII